jgi:hypothetical protein
VPRSAGMSARSAPRVVTRSPRGPRRRRRVADRLRQWRGVRVGAAGSAGARGCAASRWRAGRHGAGGGGGGAGNDACVAVSSALCGEPCEGHGAGAEDGVGGELARRAASVGPQTAASSRSVASAGERRTTRRRGCQGAVVRAAPAAGVGPGRRRGAVRARLRRRRP